MYRIIEFFRRFNFMVRQSSAKTLKIGPLKNFLLYSMFVHGLVQEEHWPQYRHTCSYQYNIIICAYDVISS